jgi:hypothetical protein
MFCMNVFVDRSTCTFFMSPEIAAAAGSRLPSPAFSLGFAIAAG